MDEKTMNRPHRLTLQDRKAGSFTGFVDVLSFDVNEILLETEQGMLHITDLHVRGSLGRLTVYHHTTRVARLIGNGSPLDQTRYLQKFI